jgi:two-component system C4-dicarboxylate transport response regulator DctD
MVITARDGTAGGFSPDALGDSNRLLSMPPGEGLLRDELEKVERRVIETALKESKGEINATWQALGISRRALYERMKKYNLDRESYK